MVSCPGLVDLDEIRALFVLLADDLHDLLRIVGVVGVRQDVLGGIEMIGILVAAENVDGIARDAQPRPDDEACVDGIAYRRIGGARPFGAHVALGGEARHQIVTGGAHREQGALRHGFFDGLQILIAGMQE